jgi:hypothetical protein
MIFMMTLLVATAAVPQADAIASPAIDKGQVVFYRKGTMIGAAISCAVHEDGKKLTSLPPGHFAAIEVAPGVHDFTVQSEAKDEMRVDVQAGQVYYAECTIGMGFAAGHPHLNLSDHDRFFAKSMKLKPVVAKDEKVASGEQ